MDESNSLCLVGECRELEECFGTSYTDAILASADDVSMREVNKVVREADRVRNLERCAERAPLIAEVVNRGRNWSRLWDATLHLGTRHTDGLQALSKMLAHHGRGVKPCPLCHPNPIGHLLTRYRQELGLDRDCINSIDLLLTQIVGSKLQEEFSKLAYIQTEYYVIFSLYISLENSSCSFDILCVSCPL